MPADAFAEKFAELSRAFRAQLPQRLAEMERLAGAGPQGQAALRAIAHKIAGQGGTFGAPGISRAAAEVEAAEPERLRAALDALARASRSED
jgi:HPt (histidine-containing phosphotransfer) domain-containing protein